MENLPKVDHLLLLVGGNPVPNAVAARLLLKENGIASLICSSSTERLALKLAEQLTDVGIKCRKPHLIQESVPTDIARGVQEELDAVAKQRAATNAPPATTGLNYTGGTKAMSVHAYRAAEKMVPGLSCTYLDARALAMVVDPAATGIGIFAEPIPLLSAPTVPSEIRLGLEDLIKLHRRRPEPLRRNPKSPILAKELVAICTNEEAWPAFRTWKNHLRARCRKDGRDLPETELRNIKCELPAENKLPGLRRLLKGENEGNLVYLCEAGVRHGFVPVPKSRYHPCWSFVEFLDGKWLEDIVLQALKDISGACALHDCCRSVKAFPPADKTQISFEVDAAAMRGYQLFAFSCGTASGRDERKLKLLEIVIRARQLGGDEARAALVCTASDEDAKKLEEEVFSDTGVEGSIKVFGVSTLLNLKDHLETWIQKQARVKGKS